MTTGHYYVNDMYTSIQGEGVQTGIPMHIVRLQGCGVGCAFCDTKETWALKDRRERGLSFAMGQNPNYAKLAPEDVARYVRNELTPLGGQGARWVLLTGGEPGEQDVRGLVETLQASGYLVACETSGTAAGVLDANIDWLTVSPKIGMPGRKSIIPEVLEQADEVKHVVGRREHYETLMEMLEHVDLRHDCTVCLQPMSRSEKATKLCTELCMQHGHTLSIQTHLMAGLR